MQLFRVIKQEAKTVDEILTDNSMHQDNAKQLQAEIEALRAELTRSRRMVEVLTGIVDSRLDEYSKGHSVRVAEYSKALAEKMGKSVGEQEELYEAGLVHDLGKAFIDAELLRTDIKFTDEQYETMKKHPELGISALADYPEFNGGIFKDVILYHHERWNGRGYPQGLSGEAIPEVARVVALADSYDAIMTREYSRKDGQMRSQEDIIEDFQRNLGVMYDPVIGQIAIDCIREGIWKPKALDENHVQKMMSGIDSVQEQISVQNDNGSKNITDMNGSEVESNMEMTSENIDRNNVLSQEDENDIRGAFHMEGGKGVVEIFDNHDLSTVVHEFGHKISIDFMEISGRDDAADWMKADRAVILNFVNMTDEQWRNTPNSDKVDALEKIAYGFESHMVYAESLSGSMETVYDKAGQAMYAGYEEVKDNTSCNIPDDVREVFDRWAGKGIMNDAICETYSDRLEESMTMMPFAERAEMSSTLNKLYDELSQSGVLTDRQVHQIVDMYGCSAIQLGNGNALDYMRSHPLEVRRFDNVQSAEDAERLNWSIRGSVNSFLDYAKPVMLAGAVYVGTMASMGTAFANEAPANTVIDSNVAAVQQVEVQSATFQGLAPSNVPVSAQHALARRAAIQQVQTYANQNKLQVAKAMETSFENGVCTLSVEFVPRTNVRMYQTGGRSYSDYADDKSQDVVDSNTRNEVEEEVSDLGGITVESEDIEVVLKDIIADIATTYARAGGYEYNPAQGDSVIFPEWQSNHSVYIHVGDEYLPIDMPSFVNKIDDALHQESQKGYEIKVPRDFNERFKSSRGRSGYSSRCALYAEVSGSDVYKYNEFPNHQKMSRFGYDQYVLEKADGVEYNKFFENALEKERTMDRLGKQLPDMVRDVLSRSPYKLEPGEMVSVSNKGQFVFRRGDMQRDFDVNKFVKDIMKEISPSTLKELSAADGEVKDKILKALDEAGLHSGEKVLENGYTISLDEHGKYFLKDEMGAQLLAMKPGAKSVFIDGNGLESIYIKGTMAGSKLMEPTVIKYDSAQDKISYEHFGHKEVVSVDRFHSMEGVFGRNPGIRRSIQEAYQEASRFRPKFEKLKESVQSGVSDERFSKKLEGARVVKDALYLMDGTVQIGEFNFSRDGEVRQNGSMISPDAVSDVFKLLKIDRADYAKMFDAKFPQPVYIGTSADVMAKTDELVHRISDMSEIGKPDSAFSFSMGYKDYVSHNGKYYEARDSKGDRLVSDGHWNANHKGNLIEVDASLFNGNVKVLDAAVKADRERFNVMMGEKSALERRYENLLAKKMALSGIDAPPAGKNMDRLNCLMTIENSNQVIYNNEMKIRECRRQQHDNNSSLWKRFVSFIKHSDAKLDQEIAGCRKQIESAKQEKKKSSEVLTKIEEENPITVYARRIEVDLINNVESQFDNKPTHEQLSGLIDQYKEKIDSLDKEMLSLAVDIDQRQERVNLLKENCAHMNEERDRLLLSEASVLADTISRGCGNEYLLGNTIGESIGDMRDAACNVLLENGDIPAYSKQYLRDNPEVVSELAKISNDAFEGKYTSSMSDTLDSLIEKSIEYKGNNTVGTFEAVVTDLKELGLGLKDVMAMSAEDLGKAAAEHFTVKYSGNYNIASAEQAEVMTVKMISGYEYYTGEKLDVKQVQRGFAERSQELSDLKLDVMKARQEAGKEIFSMIEKGVASENIAKTLVDKAEAICTKSQGIFSHEFIQEGIKSVLETEAKKHMPEKRVDRVADMPKKDARGNDGR